MVHTKCGKPIGPMMGEPVRSEKSPETIRDALELAFGTLKAGNYQLGFLDGLEAALYIAEHQTWTVSGMEIVITQKAALGFKTACEQIAGEIRALAKGQKGKP
jgi:hypothetical protein